MMYSRKTALIGFLALGMVACGSGSSFDEELYQSHIEDMRQTNQRCLNEAQTFTDLSVCEDMLNRNAERIMNQLESGYYGEE